MTRIRGQHLMVLVAMLHLATDAAFATSAVLCVGSEGHIAVEARHLGPANHAASDRASASADSSLVRVTANRCLDTPLHPDCAEMVSGRIDGSEIDTRLTQLTDPLIRPSAAHPSALALSPAARLVDALPPGTRSHRTTVLLL